MLKALIVGNLALAFLLELCMLVALVAWGLHAGSGTGAKILLGVGAPLVAAVVWGVLMAPRAAVRLPRAIHLALYIVIFGVAALALASAGYPTLAWALFVLAALSKSFALAFPQPDSLNGRANSPRPPSAT
ncbi:MAG TPA: YrdB family protein [Ktedonobacterales bacterium]